MTEKQKEIVEKTIIFLKKEDVRNTFGWGKNAVDKLFASKDFPSIRIGKYAEVEVGALKEFLNNKK